MPPEASSNVDYATGASPAADTRQDIWSLTPEQATAVLAERAADFHQQAPIVPVTPHDADVALQRRINNPEWARKLMNGDIATRDEFQRLSELKASGGVTDAIADQTLISVTQGDTGVTRSNLISIAEDMRREGVFNDHGIEFILSDQKFSTEAVRDAQFWLPQLERDETILCPDLPDHWTHEHQVKFLRTIATIGDGSMP
jgi:hypothetical protein